MQFTVFATHRITEFPELEGTHKDHQVQLLSEQHFQHHSLINLKGFLNTIH